MSREIFDLPPYSEIWKDTKKRTPLGERELLVHALDRLKHINFEDDHLTNDLIQTIQKYLDQPEQEQEQEPVAWMYDWDDEHERTYVNLLTTDTEHKHLKTAFNVMPLYASPPKRESLSDGEILKGIKAEHPISRSSFTLGVKFAEKEHGITGVDK